MRVGLRRQDLMSCRSKTGGRAADPVQIEMAWVGAGGGGRQALHLRVGLRRRDLMSWRSRIGGGTAGPVQIRTVLGRTGAQGLALAFP